MKEINEILKKNDIRSRGYKKIGKVIVADTNVGKLVIKENKDKDYIYNYLNTRSFNYYPEIIESDKFNLNILTHVNSLEEAVAKIRYLRKHFKDITIIPCPKQISKTKMVHTEDAILIDDYAGNLRQWQQDGGIPVRFSQKNNGKGYRVLNKLDQIIDMF